MDLFEILMGGGSKRQEYEDFGRRYEQGPPWEGYTDQEVLDRYGEVAHKLPAADYEAAVREALSRLSPGEQAAFLRDLQDRTRGRESSLREPRQETGGRDLDQLARSVRELHEEPGRLRDALTRQQGGEPRGVPGGIDPAPPAPSLGEGLFQSPLAKAAIAGITAMLVRRMLSPR
jgi:hypothetical protein